MATPEENRKQKFSPSFKEEHLSPRRLTELLGAQRCAKISCDRAAEVACSFCGLLFYCDQDCSDYAWEFEGHKSRCKALFERPKPVRLNCELKLSTVVNALVAAIVEPDELRRARWPKFKVKKLYTESDVLVVDVWDTGSNLSPRKNYINYMTVRNKLPYAVAARLPFLDFDAPAAEALALFIRRFVELNRGVLMHKKVPIESAVVVKCLFVGQHNKLHLQETNETGQFLHAASRRTHYVVVCYTGTVGFDQPVCVADPTIMQYDASLPFVVPFPEFAKLYRTPSAVSDEEALRLLQSPRSPRLTENSTASDLFSQLVRNLSLGSVLGK